MKVLHINAGLEKGGGLSHIVNLLTEAKIENADFELLTLADGPVAQTAKKAGIKTTILGAQSRYDLSVFKAPYENLLIEETLTSFTLMDHALIYLFQ